MCGLRKGESAASRSTIGGEEQADWRQRGQDAMLYVIAYPEEK
jgi:hypothetical protein